jgi:N-acetylneuraminic acid mutarotase
VVTPAINVLPTKADTSDSWTTMAPMPTARGQFGVAVVNGKIYVIGGTNDGMPLNTVEVYDPKTNQWLTETPMPTARSSFATAVYHNQIYVIGGTVGSGFVGNNEVYDPASHKWQTKTSMPTPRADLSANVVNDKIYLIGGKRYSSTSPFYAETNINEVYSPLNDTWTTETPIPNGVQGYTSTVLDDKIYIMGGSRQASPENTLLTDSVEIFTPKTGNWSLGTKLPHLNSYGSATATVGFMVPPRIYYIGGFSSEFNAQNDVYFPENNSWGLAAPMPTPRAYFGLATLNDVLYAIGGYNGKDWLAINERYTPAGYGTVPPKVEIISPENRSYTEVALDFTINRGAEWMGYSLDNQANVTIKSVTKLSGLSDGAHSVKIYANDSYGNMGFSNTIFFSIDTHAPRIDIVLPANQSYGSTDIQLEFTLDENVTNLAYSLDNQANITIVENVTLPALSEGSHRLTIYATDSLGNAGSKTVYFNIAPFPIIAVVAVLATITIVLASVYLFLKRRKPSGTEEEISQVEKGLPQDAYRWLLEINPLRLWLLLLYADRNNPLSLQRFYFLIDWLYIRFTN